MAAVRMLGGGVTFAYVLQFTAAAAVTVMTVYAWYRGRGSFELRAAISLARLWGGQKRYDEARSLLAPIYNWYSEGFDTHDLRQAKDLLGKLA